MVDQNRIMDLLLLNVLSTNVEIGEAALSCLVLISSTYYNLLESYIESLYGHACSVVKGGEKPVALQAVMLLKSLLEKELELVDGLREVRDHSESPYSHAIEKALPQLVPILLDTLLKQEENQDGRDDSYSISMVAGSCLDLLALIVRDAVWPHVKPFVEANISSPLWRYREAATSALGQILGGPKVETLFQFVSSNLKLLLKATKHENNHVKETTAWVWSCMLDTLHSPADGYYLITDANIHEVVSVLLESLKDVPNVAENICFSISSLANVLKDVELYMVTYIQVILESLWKRADRTADADTKVRFAAYDAMMDTLRCANLSLRGQCIRKLFSDMPLFSPTNNEKRSFVCRVVEFTRELDDSKCVIVNSAEDIVSMLQVYLDSSPIPLEEAMCAIGALAYHLRGGFVKHVSVFNKYLVMGLQNLEEHRVFSITVGVVGDICLAIEQEFLESSDLIVPLLLEHLSCREAPSLVKSKILSCLGNIALAIGPSFGNYLTDAIPVMQSIYDDQMDLMDLEDVWIMSEAYLRILGSFKDAKPRLIVPHTNQLFQFLELVFMDKKRGAGATKMAAEVFVGLADSLGQNMKEYLRECPHWVLFIDECIDNDQLERIGKRALKLIGKIVASPS